VERISFWISSDRKRGSKSFKVCTSCGARLFTTDLESLEFYGCHPSRVLCLSCKEAMDRSSASWRPGSLVHALSASLTRADTSRPNSIGVSTLAWVLVGCLLCASVAIRSVQSRAQALPFEGVRDLVLVYVPYNPNDEQVTTDWLAPYVSYLDEDGRSKEWLFDSFLFLSIFSESKACFWGYSTASDWRWWIDKIFAEGEQVDALNKEVERVKRILGNPSKRGVIISIPYPDPAVDDFGLRSKDGRTLSFSPHGGHGARDRLQACVWFVDEVAERWRSGAHRYNNLELIGFYWFQEELLEGDATLVNELGAHIRSQGFKFFWIPYNSESNIQAVKDYSEGDLGFDFVWIQPNCHSSREGIQERWNEQRDIRRVAELAGSLGASIEIEMDRRLYQTGDLECLNYFYDYLDQGLSLQYIDKALAYYVFPTDLYRSQNPIVRRAYEALCEFVKGRYRPVGYFLHCDVGANDGSSKVSSIILESTWGWGSPEVADGSSCRLALPGAVFVLDQLDPSKDLVLAVRYQTAHEGHVQVRLEDSWETVGELVADGLWHTGHWPVRLSGSGVRHIAVSLTNITRVSDIWAYPDETIFRLQYGSGQSFPGLYCDHPKEGDEWRLGPGREVTFVHMDSASVWIIGATYRASTPVTMSVAYPDVTRSIVLGPSSSWTSSFFCTERYARDGPILLRFEDDVEVQEIWAAPRRLHTDVGTSWDTSPQRHDPGACVGAGWSASRRTYSSPRVTYRSGGNGSTIHITTPDASVPCLLSLLYRSEDELSVRISGAANASVKELPAASGWGLHTISLPPSTGPLTLEFMGPVDLASMWVELACR